MSVSKKRIRRTGRKQKVVQRRLGKKLKRSKYRRFLGARWPKKLLRRIPKKTRQRWQRLFISNQRAKFARLRARRKQILRNKARARRFWRSPRGMKLRFYLGKLRNLEQKTIDRTKRRYHLTKRLVRSKRFKKGVAVGWAMHRTYDNVKTRLYRTAKKNDQKEFVKEADRNVEG